MKLLLIDDNPDILRVLRHLLFSDEEEVDVALSRDEGLAFVKRAAELHLRLDCIILDWMEGIHGAEEFIPVLRKETPFTGIIVITGYEDDSHAVQAFQAGADDFVPKTKIMKMLRPAITGVVKIRRTLAQKILGWA